MGYVKMKNFYFSENMIERVPRESTEWDKLCIIHNSKRGLVFRRYKEPLQINKKVNKHTSQSVNGKIAKT